VRIRKRGRARNCLHSKQKKGMESKPDSIPYLRGVKGENRYLTRDLGLDRKAGTQEMVLILICQIGEVDADRDALHDLDVVAGGILRREERENRAGGAADLGDFAR
jgi:hypothetical protein